MAARISNHNSGFANEIKGLAGVDFRCGTCQHWFRFSQYCKKHSQRRITTMNAATPENQLTNEPRFGLNNLEKIIPNPVDFVPQFDNDEDLHKEVVGALKEADSFSLKGDTSIYARVTLAIAELVWANSANMGFKAGTAPDGGVDKGIQLSFATTRGFKPNPDAWKEVRAIFLSSVDKASVETGTDFRAMLESPSTKAILSSCYRAGMLIALGAADIRCFKKGKRPELGTLEVVFADGEEYDSRKHVKAPSAPCNVLQPEIVSKPVGKVGKPTVTPNREATFTYMSAANAMLLHDRLFGNEVVVDADKGTLKRRPQTKGTRKAATEKATTKVEVSLAEDTSPDDVWRSMQAMTSQMEAGEVEIPIETQKNAIATVQEMIENLDKGALENLGDDLTDLQAAIELKAEEAGIANSIFLQAHDRLMDSKGGVIKMDDEHRIAAIALYNDLHKQISAIPTA